MKNKEVFLISLSIFLTIFAWLWVDIYQVSKKTKEMVNKQHQVISIGAINFDRETLKLLKEKK